jgi:hypothetical protein
MGADIDDTPASRHSERLAEAGRGARKSSAAGVSWPFALLALSRSGSTAGDAASGGVAVEAHELSCVTEEM